MDSFVVKKEEENNRIDCYLAKKKDLSRVAIQRLIGEEKILVKGKKTFL